jgi:hypothetical protein
MIILFIFYTTHKRVMAKNANDIILRDRMEFDLDSSGNRTTLYGRIDLSSYVNAVSRDGLAIKQVLFHVRDQSGGNPNTGSLSLVGDWASSSGSTGQESTLKVYATTRAYENASEVGIASPDVLCVLEMYSAVGITPSGTTPALITSERFYGPKDLHPDGFTVVSDLLIGVAADTWVNQASDTLEIDIMLICEPVKITTERMNEILSQAQDL